MALAMFDTLEFVETLKEAGVPEKQAKAFSTAVRKSHESSDVATKQDIAELRHEISDLRKDMDAKLERAKFDLLRWMVGLAIGNFAFLVGIFWKVMSIPGAH